MKAIFRISFRSKNTIQCYIVSRHEKKRLKHEKNNQYEINFQPIILYASLLNSNKNIIHITYATVNGLHQACLTLGFRFLGFRYQHVGPLLNFHFLSSVNYRYFINFLQLQSLIDCSTNDYNNLTSKLASQYSLFSLKSYSFLKLYTFPLSIFAHSYKCTEIILSE